MKGSKKSISTMLCMLILVFVCMAGVSAKAASPAGLFSAATVSGGVKITAYFGAEDVLEIPATLNGKRVVGIASNFIASAHRSEIEKVIIPDYVTSIDSNAFKGCTSLEEVHLGSRVISIGASAFEGCESLSVINYPSALRTIGSRAFYGCEFNKVTLPGTVETIHAYAYGNIRYLTDITFSNGTKALGNNICYNCPNLNQMTIPSSVTSIGSTLVPHKDVELNVPENSYVLKYINNKNLSNPVNSSKSVRPTSLKFKQKEYICYEGQTLDLYSELLGTNTTTYALVWGSSRTSLFTVDRYGKITAKKYGTGTLVAKAMENPSAANRKDVKTSTNIIVKKAPSRIAIIGERKGSVVRSAASSSHQIKPGDSITLAARSDPDMGAPITFSCSDKNGIVSLSTTVQNQKIGGRYYSTCTIKGLKEGTVEIIAKTYNGKTMIYPLTVENTRKTAPKNWGMPSVLCTVRSGSVYGKALLTTAMPKDVRFVSSNTSIATVDAKGVVTGKRPGFVTIRAYTSKEKAETKFAVVPSKIVVTSAMAGTNHKLTLKWKKQSSVSGYQIAYRKSGSSKWTYKTVSSSKYSYTTPALAQNAKYYVRVRGYVKSGKMVGYGSWSNTKTLIVK